MLKLKWGCCKRIYPPVTTAFFEFWRYFCALDDSPAIPAFLKRSPFESRRSRPYIEEARIIKSWRIRMRRLAVSLPDIRSIKAPAATQPISYLGWDTVEMEGL